MGWCTLQPDRLRSPTKRKCRKDRHGWRQIPAWFLQERVKQRNCNTHSKTDKGEQEWDRQDGNKLGYTKFFPRNVNTMTRSLHNNSSNVMTKNLFEKTSDRQWWTQSELLDLLQWRFVMMGEQLLFKGQTGIKYQNGINVLYIVRLGIKPRHRKALIALCSKDRFSRTAFCLICISSQTHDRVNHGPCIAQFCWSHAQQRVQLSSRYT